MEQPNYYAIIPADIRYDCRLTDKEKLLYGEITALSNKEGCCWASNEYFSRLYNSSIRTIKGAVTKLEKCGYLKRVLLYKENSKEVEKRLLYPVTKFALPSENNFTTPGEENFHHPGEKNCTDNNTSKKNNTSKNNTCITNSCIMQNDTKNASKFSIPTIEELETYIEEKGLSIDAIKFHSYYESNGWKVGKNPMKNWKAALTHWERNNKKEEAPKKKKYKGIWEMLDDV